MGKAQNRPETRSGGAFTLGDRYSPGPGALDLLAPYFVLPEQMAHGVPVTGEVLLLAACLDNAIRSYLLHSTVDAPRSEAIVAELRAWFESPEDAYPFAFRSICDALRMDPGRVWAGIRDLRDQRRQLPRQARQFAPRNRTPMGVGIGGRRGMVVNG